MDLRLYYGNVYREAEVEAPRYDFARNLPPRLEPKPTRAALGQQQVNPLFVPPPLPLTERWPWLIYVVLGLVSLVLAGAIVSVGRTAIAAHDAPDKGAA